MKNTRQVRSFPFIVLCVITSLLLVAVACGADDEAPGAAPAATPAGTAPTSAAPAPTEAPAADEPTATPLATTRAPAARPQIDSTPTPIPVATAVPAAPAQVAQPKITRVSMVNTVPLNESNRIWVGGWPNLVQNDPYGETLIENHEITSEPVPALANSWVVDTGFKTWTFQLNKGIPWHFGYGEFTAADVAHTSMLVCQDDYLPRDTRRLQHLLPFRKPSVDRRAAFLPSSRRSRNPEQSTMGRSWRRPVRV